MTMRSRRLKIYQTSLHLFFTLATLLVPFLFFLLFSEFSHIALNLLLPDVLISLSRMVFAYAISAVLAWVSAILFFQGKRSVIALPIFDVLQSFPTFAALPLATLAWGPSNFTIIFFLVVAIIWPVFFSIISSLKLIRHDWEEAVAISRLRGIDYVRYFLLPVSISGLITGSIIGLGEGWEALIATEIIIGIKPGLGNFFQSVRASTSVTAFGILGFLLIIFSVNKLVWLPLLDWSHRLFEE